MLFATFLEFILFSSLAEDEEPEIPEKVTTLDKVRNALEFAFSRIFKRHHPGGLSWLAIATTKPHNLYPSIFLDRFLMEPMPPAPRNRSLSVTFQPIEQPMLWRSNSTYALPFLKSSNAFLRKSLVKKSISRSLSRVPSRSASMVFNVPELTMENTDQGQAQGMPAIVVAGLPEITMNDEATLNPGPQISDRPVSRAPSKRLSVAGQGMRQPSGERRQPKVSQGRSVSGASRKQAEDADDEDANEKMFFAASKVQKSIENATKHRFDEMWNDQVDDVLRNIDIEKTYFSVQDVIELVLLNTQQIHMLRLNHEYVTYLFYSYHAYFGIRVDHAPFQNIG